MMGSTPPVVPLFPAVVDATVCWVARPVLASVVCPMPVVVNEGAVAWGGRSIGGGISGTPEPTPRLWTNHQWHGAPDVVCVGRNDGGSQGQEGYESK